MLLGAFLMVSILLATWNRCGVLAETLESFTKLSVPDGGWKVVVVDNNSSDGTGRTLRSFEGRLPLIALRETRAGKNAALETGMRATEGDLVVFTDDDVLASSDWLVQYRRGANTVRDYNLFSGAVFPKWHSPPPDWILNDRQILGVCYAATRETEAGPIRYQEVRGANFAIRKRLYETGRVQFDTDLGPKGTEYSMGSETSLLQRLDQEGERAYFLPEAVVWHQIPAEQMTRKWALKRAVRSGRGSYRLGLGTGGPAPAMLFGFPRHAIRQVCEQTVRVIWVAVAGDSEQLFQQRWRLQFYKGCLLEGRAMFGGRRAPEPRP